MKYRVVHEVEVEADNPIEAFGKYRDITEDHRQHPVLLIYSDNYRVVHELDSGKPMAECLRVITPPVFAAEPIEEREY